MVGYVNDKTKDDVGHGYYWVEVIFIGFCIGSLVIKGLLWKWDS